MKNTIRFYVITLACTVVIVMSGSLFSNLLFLVYDDASGRETKVIRQVKVVSAKINPKDSRVFFELENTRNERWWHETSTIKYSECPKLEYNKPKNVYIVSHTTRFTKKQRHAVEGVSTFCWPAYTPNR